MVATRYIAIKKLVLMVTLMVFSGTISRSESLAPYFKTLDESLKTRQTFMTIREERIQHLVSLLNKADNHRMRYAYHMDLYEEYQPYNSDSAIAYLEKNLLLTNQIGETVLLNETQIRLAYLLSSGGMYKEAIDLLDSINRPGLDESLILDYYLTYDHAYGEMAFYSRSALAAQKYRAIATAYKDSLTSWLDHESDQYLSLRETRLRDSGKLREALAINDKRLERISPENPLYGLVTFHRSLSYHNSGETDLRKKYLILSAISDTRHAIKDNASLTLLANLLYTEGAIDQAYKYIRYALEDANFYNARLRNIQVSEVQPIIDRAYQLRSENQKNKLRFFLILASVLAVFSIIALWIIYRQKKGLYRTQQHLKDANNKLQQLNQNLNRANDQLKQLNDSLSESNRVKEEYIGLYLSICSTYIDKMETLKNTVSKEITKGQVAQLLAYTKSSALIDKEVKDFYSNFDNTFLHLYPNFVEEFNALLLPEEHIDLKFGEQLNTELRIFALIRLGITDSSKIAGLLRYSVNTIYNYRAKIKNKAAVPRDDFENQVMRIGGL